MQFTIDLDERKCIKFRLPRRKVSTFKKREKKKKGAYLHVRNLCGRPTDVEHRREEAVADGPHEVRVCPQNGAEQAATEDRGEGNAHQD